MVKQYIVFSFSIALLLSLFIYADVGRRSSIWIVEEIRGILESRSRSVFIREVSGKIVESVLHENITVIHMEIHVVGETKIQFYCTPILTYFVETNPFVDTVEFRANRTRCEVVVGNYTGRLEILIYGKPLSSAVSDKAFITYSILKWVSENINYCSDPWGTDILYDPETVLRYGCGDCEDISVLIVSLLRARGVEARVSLVRTRLTPLPADHASVAVENTGEFIESLYALYGGYYVVNCVVVKENYVILDILLNYHTPLCPTYSGEDVVMIV